MAEVVVYSAAEHLGSLINQKSTNKADLSGIESKAKAVQMELANIEKFIVENLENKEVGNKEQIRSSLIKLRKMAYEAEDVVDTFVSKTETFNNNTCLGILNCFPARKTSKQLQRLLIEMKDVMSKLIEYEKEEEKEEEKDENSVRRRSRTDSSDSSKRNIAQVEEEPHVVGIQNDVEKLVEKLTLDDDLNILAIVGMGGSGKTTLAKRIYNHAKVKKHFKHQAWVTLSRRWNTNDVYEIFHQTSINTGVLDGFSKLLGLKTKKKCLVVLDNVWNCESLQKEALPKIHEAFFFEETKIIITSRHYHKSFDNDDKLNWCFHEMKLLKSEDEWDLFNKVLMKSEEEYRGLAVEMLKKCGGLPLAIVALAKLLKKKNTINEWETVFSQLMSKEGPNDLYLPVNDILAISYHKLPYYLKPCFLYFGLFPEDFIIKAGALLKMWIAEGFVQRQRREGETSEAAARRLLQQLIDQSMVQVVKISYCGKVKTLRIHGIMRDVCIQQARELEFLTVFSSDSTQFAQNYSRRAVVDLRKCTTLPVGNSHLRTLYVQGQERVSKRGDEAHHHVISRDLVLICEKYKLLRVLDINGIKTNDGIMPKAIGNLIHLRHLRINSTNIRQLPKSIGKLHKLLTLDYWNVSVDNKGIRLPNVLWKLKNLRHLYLPYEMSDISHKFKLDKIKNLQTLWGVKGGDWMLKDMPHLCTNLKKMCIQGISSLELLNYIIDYYIAVQNKDHLYSLALVWYGIELKSLKNLCSKRSLKKLSLMGKVSKDLKPLKFPSNLGKLELCYTKLEDQESLVALGELELLKFLKLDKDSYLGEKWINIGENAFPKLEELKLISLPKLDEWEMEKGAMACLKKLSIISCTKLAKIPKGLKSITTLERLSIKRMPHNFNTKIRSPSYSKEGEDFHIIQHIPMVEIQDHLLY